MVVRQHHTPDVGDPLNRPRTMPSIRQYLNGVASTPMEFLSGSAVAFTSISLLFNPSPEWASVQCSFSSAQITVLYQRTWGESSKRLGLLPSSGWPLVVRCLNFAEEVARLLRPVEFFSWQPGKDLDGVRQTFSAVRTAIQIVWITRLKTIVLVMGGGPIFFFWRGGGDGENTLAVRVLRRERVSNLTRELGTICFNRCENHLRARLFCRCAHGAPFPVGGSNC